MKEFYIGYIYDANGYYDKKYYIKKDVDTLARFVCSNPMNDKTITDEVDTLVCNTFGCFLNRVPDANLLAKLQPAVIAYQTGEKELVDIEYIKQEKNLMYQKELLD